MEPWLGEQYYLWIWIPGTVLGCTAGLWGALAGACAPRGKSRALVLGAGLLLVAASVVLLIAGVAAWASGQPYGIWYGLGLPGLIGVFVLLSLLPVVRHRYVEAELRRIAAHDV